MPGINDDGLEVAVVEDFLTLERWLAPDGAEFRPILGKRVVNPKQLRVEELHGYIPDTEHGFAVKNVLKCAKSKTITQQLQGPWNEERMRRAVECLNLKLVTTNPNNPHLIDKDIRVLDEDGYEIEFNGGWLIRGWKIDLSVIENENGVREVEFLRDQIKWVKVDREKAGKPALKKAANVSLHKEAETMTRQKQLVAKEDELVTTTAYWIPYDEDFGPG